MTLQDLVGEHELTAVDFGLVEVDCGYRKESCNAMYFTLDGKTYAAIEDPNDGYRSSMQDLEESDKDLSNRFAPVRVTARMREDGRYKCDILELIDAVTGKTVLEAGTDNYDDYYPWYVAVFTPENMAPNAS